jgi:hypothetical protein
MSQQVITRTPIKVPSRTIVTGVALFVVLAAGLAVGMRALTSAGSESAARRVAPETVQVPLPSQLCGNDVTNLVSTIAAMPPTVQAQVAGTLSPDLANGIGAIVLSADPSKLPPPPDTATLGGILTRLTPQDRKAVMNGLPVEQQTVVAAAAAQTTVVGSPESGFFAVCS